MKRLFCLIGSHDFRPHQIEEGSGTCLECRHCGKVEDHFEPKGSGGPIWVSGFGG